MIRLNYKVNMSGMQPKTMPQTPIPYSPSSPVANFLLPPQSNVYTYCQKYLQPKLVDFNDFNHNFCQFN